MSAGTTAVAENHGLMPRRQAREIAMRCGHLLVVAAGEWLCIQIRRGRRGRRGRRWCNLSDRCGEVQSGVAGPPGSWDGWTGRA